MPADPTLEAMTEHVLLLAKRHKIRVTWITKGWRRAESFPTERTAYIPVIRRPRDYLVCLHELGHVADPLARRLVNKTGTRDVVVCEGAAWAWAAEKAKPSLRRHLRAKDWDDVGYAFSSYVAGGK